MKNILIVCNLFLFVCCFSQENKLWKFQDENGKYGFMDKTGKVIIQPEYLFVSDFKEGLAYVSKEISRNNNRDYKWIFIDTTGRVIFETDDFVKEGFSNGFAILHGENGYYFVDKNGNKVINKYFADIRGNFSNGYAIVSNEKFKNFRFIDTTGNYVEHLPFLNPTVFNSGLSTFHSKERLISIFDTGGKIIIDSIQEITDLSNEYLKLKKNGKWGFTDRNGKIIINFQYDQERRKEFDKVLNLNTDSLDVIPLTQYRNVGYFRNGLAMIQKDSLWGFINLKNEIVIEPVFKKVKEFSEGLAGVTLDGKLWGFIDTTGKFIIEPQYYEVDYFKDGVAGVMINDYLLGMRWANDYYLNAIIDTTNRVLIKEPMHCFIRFRGDLIEYYGAPHFGGGVYYIDNKGNKIIPRR